MAYRRVLGQHALILWMTVAACSSEEIVMVQPTSVVVTPGDVSAIEGDRIQLVGTVHDDQNHPIRATDLVWSSSDTTIASVDAAGLVTARSPGDVAIRARFQNVTGAAKVEVQRGPFVVTVPESITLYTSPGAAPPPQLVAVSNGGGGVLQQLVAGVRYGGTPQGWLRPTLAAAAAPTSMTLAVVPAGVAAGTHTATVSVSSAAQADTAEIAVVLNVAGFAVRQTGPGTSVTESGTTDQIGVVLSSQPSASVTLLATSSDPTEVTVAPASLRFTRNNWDREQMITVRGADDIDDDADQVSTVSISVDGAQSPDAFEALAARTVSVTTVDDDEPPSLLVVESMGTTVVSEGYTTDDFTVALAAPIASNVVLEVTTSNGWEVAVISAPYAAFAPANWNVPQTVTVMGVNDFWFDGNQQVTVTVRVLDVYSDARYHGLFRTVTVWNLDDEITG